MPYDPNLGMRVYDPSEGYNRGLQLGQFASRGMQSAMDERRTRLAEDEAKLRAKVFLDRQMGLEQMNAEAARAMQANPQLTEEEARLKVFPKYAPLILGGEAYATHLANAPIAKARIAASQAQEQAAKARMEAANKPAFEPRTVTLTGPDGNPVNLVQVSPNSFSKIDAPSSEALPKQREQRQAFASAARDPHIVKLQEEYDTTEAEYKKQVATGAHFFERKASHDAQVADLKKKLDDTAAKIAEIKKGYGIQLDETKPSKLYWNPTTGALEKEPLK